MNTSDPALDLADKIRWSVGRYATADRPFFVLAFGGLGLYGGHDDFFLFLQRVMGHLQETTERAAGGGWHYCNTHGAARRKKSKKQDQAEC